MILSSVAQQEVENISANVKKGKKLLSYEGKKSKLVDMRLEDTIDKDSVEAIVKLVLNKLL